MAVLGNTIYVANAASGNVSLIQNGRVVSVIALDGSPSFISADPTIGYVYVTLSPKPKLAVISGDKVVGEWTLPEVAESILAADGRVYVGLSQRILILDGRTGEELASVPLDKAFPVLALAFSRSHQALFAGGYGITYKVSLTGLEPSVILELESYRTIGVDDERGLLYVGYYDSEDSTSKLAIVDMKTSQVLGSVPLGCDPQGMAVDEESGLVYVACSCANEVYIIDGPAFKLAGITPVGKEPADVALVDGKLYVAQRGAHSLALIRGREMIEVIPLAVTVKDMEVEPLSGRIYAVSPSAGGVFVVGDAEVELVRFGRYPADAAVNREDGTVYVVDALDSNLMVLRGNEVIEKVPLPAPAEAVAFNPHKKLLYAGRSIVDAKTLDVVGSLRLPPSEMIKPLRMAVSDDGEKLAVVAHNGMPGSSGAYIVYVLDAETGELLEDNVGGFGVWSMAVSGDVLYTGVERYGQCQLLATSLEDFSTIALLDFPCHVVALAANPVTGNLFALVSEAYYPWERGASELLILEGETLKEKARITTSWPLGPLTVEPASNRVCLFRRDKPSMLTLRPTP